ncbi:MAG: Sua5/YciO/YrdC/YwlC family protein [Mycoplasmataceae bacterium]|nr:Sua5/YciO/YrdC/YwlC family protein [Mycoplasmataceae bacterium]
MNNNIIALLRNGNVVGHSTDTVFALIAKLDKNNIRKINKLKQRDETKPIQILIKSLDQIEEFLKNKEFVKNYININDIKKTSLIVEVKHEFSNKFLIESFNNTIMFRIPEGNILNIIKKIGPLFSTSANKHGEQPFIDIDDVKNEFKIEVANIKQKKGTASKIISLVNNDIKIIRS